MILEVLESPKHGLSVFGFTMPRLYLTLYAGPGERDLCFYKHSRIRILSQDSFSLVSTAKLEFKPVPGGRAIAPLSSCSGCLVPLGVFWRGRELTKWRITFCSLEESTRGQAAPFPGCPLSKTRLAKHTASLLLAKCCCSIALDQC